MNNLSRFPGTSLHADRLDEAMDDAAQEAADAYDCAIGEVQACMAKVRIQQGAGDPHGSFESALAYLSDAISDLNFGKTKAAEEAAENVRNG